jgi:predicted PurR-regulated permease PerM
MYTLYVARAIFIPVTFAILLNLLLAPVVNFLRRLHIREEIGAAIVLVLFLTLLSASVYRFYQPATDWIERAPQAFRKIEDKLRVIKEPVEKVGEATKSVEQITEVEAKTGNTAVEMKKPGLLNIIVDQAWFAFGLATMRFFYFPSVWGLFCERC